MVAPLTVTVTVPPAPIVTGLDGEPVTPEYATVLPAVPLMVNTAFCPEHIGLLLLTVGKFGNGFTVIVDVAPEVLLQVPLDTVPKVIV